MTGRTVVRGGPHAPAVPVGRPSRWALVAAALTAVAVTADLLTTELSERLDLRVSAVVGDWGVRDSAAHPVVWAVTQIGGRATLVAVLAGLVLWLARTRRTWVPLRRALLALAVLTVVVAGAKYATGRTAPAHPGGSAFFAGGASFPSGHVANAVLVWGVARWQAVEFGLRPGVQRTFRWLAVGGPVATGVAMVCLDYHWLTDAVAGAAVGVVLLGVVHALDARFLSRWVRARAGRPAN